MVEISAIFGKFLGKISYGLVFSGEFSRSARLFRSATANSFVSASYFRNLGKKIAKIPTKITQAIPPEVTEMVKEVADAIDAARSWPTNGPIV
jgi:hypothetical protein